MEEKTFVHSETRENLIKKGAQVHEEIRPGEERRKE